MQLGAEDIILNEVEKMRPEWEKAGVSDILQRIMLMYLREVENIKDIKEDAEKFNFDKSIFIKLSKKFGFIEKQKLYEDLDTEEKIALAAIKKVNETINYFFK